MKNKNIYQTKTLIKIIIGTQLMELRRSRGITGLELANKLGISQQQVSRYERGVSHIDTDMLFFILIQLNVSLFDFFSNVFEELKEKDPSFYLKHNFIHSSLDISSLHQYSLFSSKEEIFY